MKKITLVIVILLAIGSASYYGFKFYSSRKTPLSEANQSAGTNRQAVFLSNGQVYFGFVSGPDQQIVVLRDVYYFKPEDLARLRDGSSSDPNSSGSSAAKNISLIKLGSEMYGPDGTMYINRDQILYFEDIKNDSKINEAIKQQSRK